MKKEQRLILFISVFVILAFSMKIVGEVIHEIMGHGSFVLLFGNEISNVHILILWPYELSHISWSG